MVGQEKEIERVIAIWYKYLMNDLSMEDRRIFERMVQLDRIKTSAASIKGKFAQILAGLRTVDEVAEEEALEKEELREMAIKDQLTGAWNKHYMNAVLHHEVRSRERKTTPLSGIFLDIDHFKDVNDAEKDKHAAGDRTLVALKKILEEVAGEGVDVGRWGGEEWLLLGGGYEPGGIEKNWYRGRKSHQIETSKRSSIGSAGGDSESGSSGISGGRNC